MDIFIEYPPDHWMHEHGGETIQGESMGDDLVRLTSFSSYLPLVPDDVVRVENGQFVEPVEFANVWMIKVFANAPDSFGVDENGTGYVTADALDDTLWAGSAKAADEMEVQLRNATHVDRGTTVSMTITTPTREWFARWVEVSPHVDFIEILREPGMTLEKFKPL